MHGRDARAVLVVGLIAAGLFWWSRRARQEPAATSAEGLEEVVISARRLDAGGLWDWLEPVKVTAQRVAETVASVAGAVLAWSPPAAAARFASIFASAASQYALPAGLLERVAWQESRFRDDIITGKTVSSAGAQGIMQIVPRWHPGVDPLDPAEAIPYAASYLRSLYRQFGTWRLALAAYNWGPGNISKYRDQPERWPAETIAYARDITRDLGLT